MGEEFFAAINRDDMQGAIRDFDPQIVRIEPDGFPTAGTHRGIAEVRAHGAHGRETWSEGACEPEQHFENGDKAVVHLHVRVRLTGAAGWIDARCADGFVLRDGMITEYRSVGQRADALTCAGLDDQSGQRNSDPAWS